MPPRLPDKPKISVTAMVDDIADLVACMRPEKRAGLAACVLMSAVTARSGMRMIPAIALSVAAGFLTEQLYVIGADVHRASLLAADLYQRRMDLMDGADALLADLKEPADAAGTV